MYDAAVIGANIDLRETGVTDVVILENADEVIGSVFDDATGTWTLTTRDGEKYWTRVVIAADQYPGPQRDGVEPYLGVAMHGVPNYFLITGDDARAQLQYIVECLKVMERTGSIRIEVRRSSQQLYNERRAKRAVSTDWQRMRKRIPSAFDLTSGRRLDDEVYDGPAVLTIAGDRHAVRVRLTGQLDPIDGRYHWQGMVFSAPPATMPQPVLLTIDDRTAPARITEQTPWDSYAITGVGRPPFPLDDVELVVPGGNG